MSTNFHADPLIREELIIKYLAHRLDRQATGEFEDHYLQCDECFEELRTSDLIRNGFARSAGAARYE